MQAAKMTSCLAGFPAVTDQLRSVLEAGMELAIYRYLLKRFLVTFQKNFAFTSVRSKVDIGIGISSFCFSKFTSLPVFHMPTLPRVFS
jgi:hypothetical protein